MSITLDDKATDVFKLYDELAIAYSKDIDGYKALIKAIEAMLAQKEEMLRDIKDKAIHLIKNSMSSPAILPSRDTSFDQPVKKYNYAGVIEEDLKPGKDVESENAVVGMSYAIAEAETLQASTRLIQEPKARRANQKKTTAKGKKKTKRADKPKKPSLRSKKKVGKSNKVEESNTDQLETSLKINSKAKPTGNISEIKCKYHPESPASDLGRQLCASCKWKLINSGLTTFDKEPEVISFLKGEITTFPDLGQSMCPIHPAVPSYNKKTGLCKDCQKKAKEIGIQDRHLTEEELNILRNPAL